MKLNSKAEALYLFVDSKQCIKCRFIYPFHLYKKNIRHSFTSSKVL